MKLLYIIPARGGSKGIPGKNLKVLGGKPLILWTTEVARQLADAGDICVTTDDPAIMAVVRDSGLPLPFIRPAELAADTSGTDEVLRHALNYYEFQGKKYDAIVLLQPTSPFRISDDIKNCITLYNAELDMVVSVKETDANPYYNLFEETEDGFLRKSKEGHFITRQECPRIYQYNGAVYVINVESLKKANINGFSKVIKYIMPPDRSIDLDTPRDWEKAENNILP